MSNSISCSEKPGEMIGSQAINPEMKESKPSQPEFIKSSPSNSQAIPLKSVGVAVILGLIVPGTGHIYIGRLQKGILFLAITYGLVIGSMGISSLLPSSSESSIGWTLPSIILLFSGLGLWLYSVADAADVASECNNSIRQNQRASL